MKIAYLDSSYPVAIALDEPGSRDLLVQISRFDRLFSSNLLEAELKSALAREGTQGRAKDFLTWMRWVFPYRRLTPEIVQILQVGTLKGAGLPFRRTPLHPQQLLRRLSQEQIRLQRLA